jgi:hypothetical protein
MSEDSNDQKFDARIVQTVRNLRKLPSRQSDETKSDSDNSKNNVFNSSKEDK